MEVLRSEEEEGQSLGLQRDVREVRLFFRTVGGEDVDLQESRLPGLSCSRT